MGFKKTPSGLSSWLVNEGSRKRLGGWLVVKVEENRVAT